MSNSNILLILGSSPFRAPYLNIYTKYFDSVGVSYDVAYQNHYGDELINYGDNFICPAGKYNTQSSLINRAYDTYKFCEFAKSLIKKNNYKLVIVFTIQQSVIMAIYLWLLNIKYICDIRDYSPILKLPFIKYLLQKIVNKSAFTAISSNGFKSWLPKSTRYVLSHNILKSQLSKNLISTFNNTQIIKSDITFKLLTIGQIRDYSANKSIIDALSNNPRFLLIFSGLGRAYDSLQEYVRIKSFNNVVFTGRYEKKDEPFIIDNCDIMNIYLDTNINSDSLMSNRFYQAIMMHKPMIVNKESYHAHIVKNFNLGLVVDSVDNLSQKLLSFLMSYDKRDLQKNCSLILNDILNDVILFEDKLKDVMNQ